ncbi:flagellar basal-body rod protein FlgG [Hypnocyclicus thermotrophus]|uniref:Flagellar basal-body rod protein FlgG n=1 Tax=Hypnocyclicus thermotrophus TaxID=1627895 RepID=A0AA46I624_9FUSO|nr:flagellar basal-body rod protein FlgG [Hypnocyclicus thermotrophus]TDT71566.1 flagellar basal-body rod protein FlgG [Hypnocyclicus thermotrophus]
MMTALYSAATGMNAQQLNMDVISNNLSNVDTSGYKKSRVDFEDLMYSTKQTPGATTGDGSSLPTGLQVGNGVRAVGTKKLFTQGNFKNTGNELDIAIEGRGFFQVLRPDGSVAYTRDGSFSRDANGQLVNAEGFLLDPSIVVPAEYTNLSIGQDGVVTVDINGQQQEIGTITLANFVNPAGLQNLGKNLYAATPASGDAIIGNPGEGALGTLLQGNLETSNVKVVNEMIDMISAQRAYEVNTKSIQTADSMLQMANNLKRG